MNKHHARRSSLAIVALVVLLAPAVLGRFSVSLLNDIGIGALVALGLVLLTGLGGAMSFGQAAFVGIAAYTSAWITTAYSASPWLGLLLALALCAGTALIIGALTLRLGGHFLPISTIAWGISIPLIFGSIEALGKHTGISGIPPLHLGALSLIDPAAIYYLIWLSLALAIWLSYNLLDSRPGRAIRSLRGGPVLLASVGADAYRLRLALFVLASLFAAVAGWLYAHKNRFVSPTPFDLNSSIEYVIMAVSGGIGHLFGSVVGSTLVFGLKNYIQDLLQLLPSNAGQLQNIVFSILFILLIHRARGGIMHRLSRWLPKAEPIVQRETAHSIEPLQKRRLPEPGSPILACKNATKRFGSLTAVNDISFNVNAGEILGLIGPNGAGKSTLFNLLTGTLPLSSGSIQFMDRDITRLGLRKTAGLGIARTFQHVKLRPNMTVLDNVALGLNTRSSTGLVQAALRLDRREEARLLAEAWRQLERTGLAPHAMQLAGNLPLGTQRILEIARALAADPILLILDEPAAGLRHTEKASLRELLHALRQDGVTILIVEHDMDFVMKLVDRLVVMNFGTKLTEGLPADVRKNPSVQAAYLGEPS